MPFTFQEKMVIAVRIPGIMPETEVLVRELSEKAYVALPFPLSNEELSAAAESFFKFLALPQEFKSSLFFLRDPNDKSGTEVGYVRQSGAKDEEYGYKDFKEYFHYHPDAKDRFADAVAQEPAFAAFMKTAGIIFDRAEETARAVLSQLDPAFPGIYDAFAAPDTPLERALRFLKYDATGKGKFLARAHYDRGGCTLALAESAPGLRIGKDDATLTEVVHKDGTALFMPGFHFPGLTGGQIPAAWHDVIQASEDTLSDDAARWAIVYFLNAPGRRLATSAEVHVPKQ